MKTLKEAENINHDKVGLSAEVNFTINPEKKSKKDYYTEGEVSQSLQNHTHEQIWPDPVCGMEVVGITHTFTYDETVYVFCSRECKEKFSRNPDDYLISA